MWYYFLLLLENPPRKPFIRCVKNNYDFMKILQSGSPCFEWGGMEIYLLNLCTALQERGHEVLLTCPQDTFVDAEAKRRGIRTVYIRNQRGEYAKAMRDYYQLMQKEKFDVVHAHNGKSFRHALMPALFHRVPVRVKTFHSPMSIKALSAKFLYRYAATHMYAVSEGTRQGQIKLGVPAEKCKVIHNSIDAAKFQQRVDSTKTASYRTAWSKNRNPLVGFAGRLVPQKGWRDFVEAIALVPEVNGVVIGDGYDQEKLKTLIVERDLSERLTFANFVTDMPNALSSLDIHILPSTYEEPCATVVLEAMAVGKPVIGTKTGGTPEMIESGETGLIVAPNAPEEIAQAIRTLITHPSRMSAMGIAGKSRVETLFSHQNMVEKIEEIYKKDR
jgi:glycosyltransferase involved in cell wall biosynthesis